MKRSLWLDCIREIKHSFSRYLSIAAIVCLGVGFFAGVNAASPDMIQTADQYYKDSSLMDIHVQSTLGLTDNDVETIQAYPGIRFTEAGYTLDVIHDTPDELNVIRIHSLPEKLNQVRLIEGRLPEKENECVVERGKLLPDGFGLDETVRVRLDDNSLKDKLVTDTFTIVGIIESPVYITYDKGRSSLASGDVEVYVMIPKESFTMEVYTDIYATLTSTKDLVFNSSMYANSVESFIEQMEDFKAEQEQRRYDEVVTTAQNTLDEEKANALSEFKKAKNELDAAKNKIDQGQKELNYQKKAAEEGFQQASEQLEFINETLKDINPDDIEVLETMLPTLKEQEQTLRQGLAFAKLGLKALEQKIANTDPNSAEYQFLIKLKEEAESQVNYFDEELKKLSSQINTMQEQYDGYQQLIAGKKKCEEVLASKPTVEKQLKEAQKKLDDGRKEYQAGLKEYNKQYDDAMQQFADAQAEIDKIEYPKWYVFTRDDNVGYSEYADNADRIAAIAKIFPAFFLLIAALVCLTSMTRMVEENRTQIGSYKALGYSNWQIASKYLIYSGSATLIGSIIGLSVGFVVFPTIIFNAYNIMYRFPDVIAPFHVQEAIISIVLAEIATLGATAFSCYHELLSVPATLMRPKAPKKATRVLLERITFLWKRFNFTQKVTIRNLFRYKKRMLMTVIGIAGCTALIVCAFGIQDSINVIGERQFGEIQKQDMIVIFNEDTDIEAFRTRSQEYPIQSQLMISSTVIDVERNNGIDIETTLVVPEDTQSLQQYLGLRTLKEHTPLTLSDHGVIISQKLSSLLNINKNDKIAFTYENQRYEVTVDDIAENYIAHYMYMSPVLYEELLQKAPEMNQSYLKIKHHDTESIRNTSQILIKDEAVLALVKLDDIYEDFADMISSLNIVVIVLIVSAAGLAFIVLINLVNINVTERMRELATIKVLGFRDWEVTQYLYRENFILTILGIFCGMFLGIALHRVVMVTVEIDTLLFGKEIFAPSFIYAAVMTMFFSLVVNIITHFTLKKINMIESLKSVE
ncbi:MAG: FtsX-like permease family protein [Erysipelotrichaceae bacterium]|nr:FtsX-like permease family protein [Erysipelotrichaceae bacterium]